MIDYRFRSIVGGGLMAFFCLSGLTQGQSPKLPSFRAGSQNPGIATGSYSGVYIRIGQDIANLCGDFGVVGSPSNPRFRLNVIATRGGFDGIKRLQYEGEVQLAIVQSDLHHFAVRASNPSDPSYGAKESSANRERWKNLADNIRLVLPLYSEAIHLVVRSSDKEKFKDLNGLFQHGAKVNVGTPGSGTMITCSLIEDMMIESRLVDRNKRWRKHHYPAEEALDILIENPEKLDAVVLVGAEPYPALTAISTRRGVQQMRVDQGMDPEPPKPKRKRSLFSRLFGGPKEEPPPPPPPPKRNGNARIKPIAKLDLLPFGNDADRVMRSNKAGYLPVRLNQNEEYTFLSGSQDPVDTWGVTACLVTHRSYGPSELKMIWVNHVVNRILSKMHYDYGLVSEAGMPKAGVENWNSVWNNIDFMLNDSTDPDAWRSLGWEMHTDPTLRKSLGYWGTVSRGRSSSLTKIIDPDDPYDPY